MTSEAVHYKVSMSNPNSHYFEVEILIQNFRDKLTSDKIRLVMPVWTPGSYLVREFARNVLDLQAYDSKSNAKLTSYKDSKNSWIIELGGAESVKVRYSVYAFEFTVDTSYLDSQHAIINGASVFMYVEGLERNRTLLTISPYATWKKISTGLEILQTNSIDRTFVAPNYDVLVDSPTEIGNQDVHSFDIGGVQHEVSIFSRWKFDQASFVADIKRIVESTTKIFEEIPYKKYVFIVQFSGNSGGGLEHLNSTHCIAQFFKMQPLQEYRQQLSLFSHEFFHAWNVKRMRPKGLGPFNYSSEVYTRSLWIAEGITSYYDDLILRRAGIYTVADYLDALCINVNQMISLPGRKWQSAEESSFDTWIKYYRQNENSPNALCSYYTQGAVIGWMIDMEIRKNTANTKSLDDVMRKVYRETYLKENRGYTDEEFEAACNEISEKSLSKEIFEARVKGRSEIDFQRYLEYAGLQLDSKSPVNENQGFLGIKVKGEPGRVIIAGKLQGSNAESSDLAVGDEIVAVDNLRVDSSKLSFYLSNKKPGSEVRLLTSRDGTINEVRATLGAKPQFEYRIFKNANASPEQRAFFNRWLLSSWDEDLKYTEFTVSPVKKQIFDYT